MNPLLKGITVLDLTNVLAGPFTGYQMALLGAEVIKVETPGSGDLARQLGADADLNRAQMGTSFLAQNAGKRSLTLNLKTAAGKQVLRTLCASADVLIENFRPGVMARLGLDYETLKADAPQLVYCAISGYGQSGPLAEAPAYDQIIQGRAGVMSITGSAASAPLRVGYPVCDTLGGMTAAFAIAAALAARAGSGAGCFIDVSMLDAALVAMGWIISNQLIAGRSPVPMGNDNFTASPSGTFETADGLLNIAANKQQQFVKLCEVIERPALITDPRFAEREQRKLNRQLLTAEIEAALATHGAAHWERRLTAVGVPAGEVLTIAEALSQEQVQHRELLMTLPLDLPARTARDITLTRSGFRVDGRATGVDQPPPTLGQHTDEILREHGYSVAAIAELRTAGAL